MNHSKRHRAILTLLQQDGTVTISDLARKLDVSLETVRRDIKPLASEGTIVKMHGAISLPSISGEAPFEKRMRENSEAKKAIAVAMAATVRDGDSIMLDTGTTTSFLARELLDDHRLVKLEVLGDPHLKAREMIVELPYPSRGTFKTVGCPLKLSDSPVAYERPPMLGEHTVSVLGNLLGLDRARIDELRAKGVI